MKFTLFSSTIKYTLVKTTLILYYNCLGNKIVERCDTMNKITSTSKRYLFILL